MHSGARVVVFVQASNFFSGHERLMSWHENEPLGSHQSHDGNGKLKKVQSFW